MIPSQVLPLSRVLVTPKKKLFRRQSMTQDIVHLSCILEGHDLCSNTSCSFPCFRMTMWYKALCLCAFWLWGIKCYASVPSAAEPSPPHTHNDKFSCAKNTETVRTNKSLFSLLMPVTMRKAQINTGNNTSNLYRFYGYI